ncbi:hypothetical protein ASF88_09320 [Leifsonia sp. Leaf336]|uniref:phosphotransferase n=1 Tax=Leifsonia sp. Leaf336 TaxID=1736341 RepID=UPI0006FAD4D7|nr:phosphotransferase [Leifsonia sp. Leaf336]KQR51804.1 hypothetical protein ASF88_09320 [Leifsonia sp. Leaf336]
MAEVPKSNTRVPWEQVPAPVQTWVAELLGEPIVGAVSQAGGFSPGAADRLTGASGSRIFAKSVSRGLNRRSFELFRSEADVWNALTRLSLPAPRFRGCAEHGDWITLAFDDVEGREPGGDDADIAAVFGALADLPEISDQLVLPPAPSRSADRSAASRAASWSSAWPELLAEGRSLLPDRLRGHGDEFAELASQAGRAAEGSRLAHLDLRPDNAILEASGTVWLVDWPWVGRAAPWFDELSYLTGLAATRPLAALDEWASRPGTALAAAAPEDVDAVLSAQGGMLLLQSSRPSRLAGLTDLQSVFALRLLDWVALRRSWHGA